MKELTPKQKKKIVKMILDTVYKCVARRIDDPEDEVPDPWSAIVLEMGALGEAKARKDIEMEQKATKTKKVKGIIVPIPPNLDQVN